MHELCSVSSPIIWRSEGRWGTLAACEYLCARHFGIYKCQQGIFKHFQALQVARRFIKVPIHRTFD